MNTDQGYARIDTTMHRCTAMSEDVSYPIDMRHGRDCKTPVSRFSPLAGKPEEPLNVNWTALAFWAVYILGLASGVAWAVLKVRA